MGLHRRDLAHDQFTGTDIPRLYQGQRSGIHPGYIALALVVAAALLAFAFS